ncbi:MAG TPA: antibiotic biosynthesis monooxygenase [Allosphingosinicella sp.]|nr:antibiotic biosynthesis monooxygenase [Allosphingosinicella sp.]
MSRPPSPDTLAHMSGGGTIARTPEPPYYAVIFTSLQTDDLEGYDEAAARMAELAATMPGYLGFEAARDGIGITVSYWTDLGAVADWKREAEHLAAQGNGRRRWYSHYATRIARVERDYSFERKEGGGEGGA